MKTNIPKSNQQICPERAQVRRGIFPRMRFKEFTDQWQEKWLTSVVSFLHKRDNILSSKVNLNNAKAVIDTLIIPLLRIGKYKEPNSKNEMEKFIGELLTLSIYAKTHTVKIWLHNPILENKLSPDFSVNNNDHYLEIYSPVINHQNTILDYYKMTDRKNIGKKIENKSKKYKNYIVKILVQILVTDFVNDMTTTLKIVKLHCKDHQIILYHGDKEYKI